MKMAGTEIHVRRGVAWIAPWIASGLILIACDVFAAECSGQDTRVHLNQLGFFTDGAKRAIIASPSRQPLGWELQDPSGEAVFTGETAVFGDDPVSGDHVHRADFSEVTRMGNGFRIVSDCAESPDFSIGTAPYGRLAFDSLAYFYHNRSGVPIEPLHAGGKKYARPAGHRNDVATCRSGEDSHGNHWPGCDYHLDVTGGWYDAGDHGKYVVNGGISVWTLMNLYERQRALDIEPSFADGDAGIPESGNGVNDLLDEVRFQLEFLLRMQAPEGARASLPVGVKRSGPDLHFEEIDASGMAHHKVSDIRWTSLPMPPHLDTEKRVLFPVSTAATLNLAAVSAQCARIWRAIDEAFGARCLDAARRAFAAAQRNPEIYFIADFEGSGMYGDDELGDEFLWAAAELYIATGESQYEEALRASPHFTGPIRNQPSWPGVAPLGVISLALAPNDLDPDEIAGLRGRIVNAARRFSAERERSGYHIPFATDQYRWGSNSEVLNRAIVLAIGHDFTGEKALRNAVIDAMDYLLGRNPLGQSYISGYGDRQYYNPHHRFWAPSFDSGLPPPPPGALSGGPNSTNPADEVAREIIASCAPQTCWRDDVRAYSLNEVAINWNAPLVWVSAYLDERSRKTRAP